MRNLARLSVLVVMVAQVWTLLVMLTGCGPLLGTELTMEFSSFVSGMLKVLRSEPPFTVGPVALAALLCCQLVFPYIARLLLRLSCDAPEAAGGQA